MAIAHRYGLLVVEDCAQAHFSEYRGKKTGTAGVFSFYPGKNLGAYGDAGGIITNDAELANKCRMFANHRGLTKHQHEMEGINSKLDGIQATVLSAKLPHVWKWNEQWIKHAQRYGRLLQTSGLELPLVRAAAKHTFHLYVVRSKKEICCKKRSMRKE